MTVMARDFIAVAGVQDFENEEPDGTEQKS